MKTRRFDVNHVSPGIAIGKALILSTRPLTLARTWIRDKDIVEEIKRFNEAISKAEQELEATIARLCRYHNTEQLKILESHKMLIQDDDLLKKTINEIEDFRINAEWAWDKTLSELKLSFINADSSYIRDKVQDIEYVGDHVLKNLMGHTELPIAEISPGSILIMHDISPAGVVNLPRTQIEGFIVEQGSDTSHNAIVARSLEIPAVFGFADATHHIENGETVIIDGTGGVIIASPKMKELEHYEILKQKRDAWEKLLLKDINLPTITKDDKYNITLKANIELAEEIQSAKDHGAQGIGLYRTEYLFLNRFDLPTEDEQYENYLNVIEQMKPHSVTIRTFDLGGDKLPVGINYTDEANPAMGVRGIRLALKEKQLFKTQLKAILRAAAHGIVKVMLPLVSSVEEVLEAKKIIKEAEKELKEEKRKFGKIKLGIMIELPSAVEIANLLADEVEFFSVGTNDLIQYSLGIDRGNEAVNHMYDHFHPAILRMLAKTAQVALVSQIECAICGEMGSDPFAAPLLIAWGFTTISMNPVAIPHVKRIIRNLSFSECKKIAKNAEKEKTATDVEEYLKKTVSPFLPVPPNTK